ncbi:MAG TPA: hypothetical protein VI338_03130 [Nitrososphaera sp.]|nr:hypothetical protein [Nitrososphaera sp.]
MSVEIALIAGSSVAGAISAAVIERIKSRSGNSPTPIQKPTPNSIRTELVSLLFEKTLASEAITRVYEASQQGRIDRLERDRLLLKYKEQLDSLNRKIQELQPAADYIEIFEMRNSLTKIIEDRISALDQKLHQLSESGSTFDIAIDPQVQKIITESKNVQTAAPVEMKQKSDEKTIEQLQNEIVQALERLEQVEIDKD